MRPAWKRLVERADNPAFSQEEVFDALQAALETDWRKEVPSRLLQRVGSILRAPLLPPFRNTLTTRLEALKLETAGYPLGDTLLDHAIRSVTKGDTGIEVLKEAALYSLVDRMTRGLRQIREHYTRESRQNRVAHLKERLSCFTTRSHLMIVVERLLRIGKSGTLRRLAKQTRLDDGVDL